MFATTMVWAGACQSSPETMKDTAETEANTQASAQAVQENNEPGDSKQESSKVVLWTYKNHDTWSKVITNAARDIRGEESDSSRCQGAADIQQVGQCVQWNLSVPCETEGEKWFYGENVLPNGSICRSKSGNWTLKSPLSFEEHGDCTLNVLHSDVALEPESEAFNISCSWLSEDRMTKGTSTFSFGPLHQ